MNQLQYWFSSKKMDAEVVRRLETIRAETPRYLFRAWSNSGSWISGGTVGLNTVQAITPLAFFRRRGRESAYRLTEKEFTRMAIDHLQTKKFFDTEFSSWSASLTFVMECIPKQNHNSTHISIIDTTRLRNEIFFVPSLDFLSPGNMAMYDWEYLAHGVIEGPALSTVALTAFRSEGFDHLRWVTRAGWGAWKVIKMTSDEIRRARRIGNLYGNDFELPVTIALICREQRDENLFRVWVKDIRTILDGLSDFQGFDEVLDGWQNNDSIMTDVVPTAHWGDVGQMIRLMRALVEYRAEVQAARINKAHRKLQRLENHERKRALHGQLTSPSQASYKSQPISDIKSARKRGLYETTSSPLALDPFAERFQNADEETANHRTRRQFNTRKPRRTERWRTAKQRVGSMLNVKQKKERAERARKRAERMKTAKTVTGKARITEVARKGTEVEMKRLIVNMKW